MSIGKVYDFDFNNFPWFVVEYRDPPEVGQAITLLDLMDCEFQCQATVTKVERNWDDSCWIVDCEQSGSYEFLDEALT